MHFAKIQFRWRAKLAATTDGNANSMNTMQARSDAAFPLDLMMMLMWMADRGGVTTKGDVCHIR